MAPNCQYTYYFAMTERISIPGHFYEQTPDGDARATEAVMNTIRTADMVFDRIGRLLRPLNVSAAGGLVLGLLRDHGAMSPSQLGDRLIVTRATVTGVVESLARRGFVQRTPSTTDRRSYLVEITPSGLAVLQQLRTLVHENEKSWLADLSDEQVTTYI